MTEKQPVHVAVGVIVDTNGKILITQRAKDVHQGGLWEFPGGKVEQSEDVREALSRELKEELAIDVDYSEPLIKVLHDYGDKSVLLDVWLVRSFHGVAKGNEGQPLTWVDLDELVVDDQSSIKNDSIKSDSTNDKSSENKNYPLPAANQSIVNALKLPSRQLITGDFSSIEEFKKKLQRALMSGLRFVQLRLDTEKYSAQFLNEIIQWTLDTCSSYDVCVVLNSNLLPLLDESLGDVFEKYHCGLHLTTEHLKVLPSLPVIRGIIGASCHNAEELDKANGFYLDYVNISPVKETQSHPEAKAIGWKGLESLASETNVPVYALGGVEQKDLLTARESGAQGVAGISDFWI